MADRTVTLAQVRNVNAYGGAVSWADDQSFRASGPKSVSSSSWHTTGTIVRVMFRCSPTEYWRKLPNGGWEEVAPHNGHYPENANCTWDRLHAEVTHKVDKYAENIWRVNKHENGVFVATVATLPTRALADLTKASLDKKRIVVGTNRAVLSSLAVPAEVASAFETLHVEQHPDYSANGRVIRVGNVKVGKLAGGATPDYSTQQLLAAYDKL